MNAILLCVGFGTRMRPLTSDTPKALVEVAGRPVLDYLMEQLVAWTPLEAIHLVHTDRHPEAFAQWQARWADRWRGGTVHRYNDGVRTDDERLGAVGDVQFVLDRIGTGEPAIVAAGDSLYRIALQPVLDRFRAMTAHGVLALSAKGEVLRQSSVLDLNGGHVQGVGHAPDTPPSRWVSPAFYGLRPSGLAHVARYLDRGHDPDTLGGFINDLARHQHVDAVKVAAEGGSDSLRFHLNTPAEHARAEDALRGEGGVGESGRRG